MDIVGAFVGVYRLQIHDMTDHVVFVGNAVTGNVQAARSSPELQEPFELRRARLGSTISAVWP